MKKNTNPTPLKPDEANYDLSDMGDAPLLAVLADAEKKKEEVEEGKEAEDGKEAKSEADESESGKKTEKKTGKDPEKTANIPESATPNESADPKVLISRLLSICLSLLEGKTLPDDLLNLLDAAKAHDEIQRARQEGEIAGRNALIEERMAPKSIGVPDLNGAPCRSSAPTSIFDLARSAK